MYLRVTQRHNRDGSSVTYYALAESVCCATIKVRIPDNQDEKVVAGLVP